MLLGTKESIVFTYIYQERFLLQFFYNPFFFFFFLFLKRVLTIFSFSFSFQLGNIRSNNFCLDDEDLPIFSWYLLLKRTL